MTKFIIYLSAEWISVSGYEDGTCFPLRKEGEDQFKYTPFFWDWFKEKIEYHEKALSFIVVSDRELVIPKEIHIAKTSAFKEIPVLQQYKNTKLYTYPDLDIKESHVILKKEKERQFADYFVSKTLKYSQ